MINDHSQDNTPGIVERLSREFPHIRLVQNTGVRGINQTLLTGWRAAATPW